MTNQTTPSDSPETSSSTLPSASQSPLQVFAHLTMFLASAGVSMWAMHYVFMAWVAHAVPADKYLYALGALTVMALPVGVQVALGKALLQRVLGSKTND